jgi:hypothetical protein
MESYIWYKVNYNIKKNCIESLFESTKFVLNFFEKIDIKELYLSLECVKERYMNKIFLMIFLCMFLYSQSHFECISLGEVCTTGAALQAFDLRNVAYPFDWVISPFLALYSVIFNDFKDYLNPEYFTIREDFRGIMNKYEIVFLHDFPTIEYVGNNILEEDIINTHILSPDWLDSLPFIQEKYERRINRFREKCNSQDKIYFFRHVGINRENAIELRNLIESTYSNLDFVLVIVGNNPAYAEPWREQKIRNYYLNDTDVWNDVREWQRIFNDLGILTDLKHSIDFIVKKYKNNLCGHCNYCQKKKLLLSKRKIII